MALLDVFSILDILDTKLTVLCPQEVLHVLLNPFLFVFICLPDPYYCRVLYRSTFFDITKKTPNNFYFVVSPGNLAKLFIVVDDV